MLSIGALTGYSSCALPDNLSVSVTTANQISGYTYDAAGNLTAIPGTGGATYTYNAESEMTTSTTSTASATYTYDGDGKRAKKSGAMVYWYGMTSAPLEETAPAGALQNDYIFFGGERIARLDATGDIFGYFADHLGSSRKMREIASGATTSTAAYDADFYPFGREHTLTSGSPIYKFEGKIRDTDTGLDDFGARYYSFTIGRFLSADWSAVPVPVPYANLTNPQTLNLYAMVSDNPETFADLDGHCGVITPGAPTATQPCQNSNAPATVGNDKQQAQTNGTGTPNSTTQQAQQSQQQNQAQKLKPGVIDRTVQKAKQLARAHPKATKAIVTTVIVVTVVSGAADEGASEALVPEEEAAGEALEAGTDEAVETSEGAGSKASDDLKSIEKAQQRVRTGSDTTRIIDSIKKSEQRLKNMLRKVYDPDDWE